jgi:hypothetical protein
MQWTTIALWAIYIILMIAFFVFFLLNKEKHYNDLKNQERELETVLKEMGFSPDVVIGSLQIDTHSRQWNLKGMDKVYLLEDIIDYEVVEDGVAYKYEKGIMKATTSGAFWCGMSAFAGALTYDSDTYVRSLNIVIHLKNHLTPVIIKVINGRTAKNSLVYSMAQQTVHNTVQIMDKCINIDNIEYQGIDYPELSNKDSAADELSKYKRLLDSGAITEEEYNNIKQRIISKI